MVEPAVVEQAILTAVLVFAGVFAVLSWRRRPKSGATALAATLLASTGWIAGRLLAMPTNTRFTSTLASALEYTGASTTLVLVVVFVLVFTGREHHVRSWPMRLLATLVVLEVALIWTNPVHRLMWSEVTPNGAFEGGFAFQAGPLFYGHLVLVLPVTLFVLGLMAWQAYTSRGLERKQSLTIFVAILAPAVGSILSLLDVTSVLFAPSFGVMTGALYLAFTDFHLVDFTPVARATVLDRIDVGVAVVDRQNRYVDMNERSRELLGLDPEEPVVGRTMGDVLADWPELYEHYREMRQGVEELEINGEAGRRTFEVQVDPFEDRLGRRVGRIFLVQDITERKHRERELRRKNDQLEDLASVVSHDLRNPLQVAMGHAELVENETAHTRIGDALDRMNVIIEDVLTLAREGNEIEETERVTLSAVARNAWGYVATEEMSLDVPSDAVIEADEPRLQRLFENLFRNSMEHGSTGGRTQADGTLEPVGGDVTVRVGAFVGDDAVDPTVGFFVEDDGPGIPVEQREEVFDAGHTTDPQGSGLGLSIVETIAHAHDWDVAVTSGKNGGARFEFTGVNVVETRDEPGEPRDGGEQRSEVSTD